MAEAMAKSWHVSGVVPAASMFCTDVNLDRRRVFESFGVTSLDNCRQVAEKSDVLILAVKPPGGEWSCTDGDLRLLCLCYTAQ